MSTLSNEFHADINAIEAFFVKELSKVESGLATALADAKTAITFAIDNSSPVIVAMANAVVSDALANVTGGLSAMVSAAVAGGLAVFKSQGIQLADEALVKFETLVRANLLKASAPTGDAAQTTGG